VAVAVLGMMQTLTPDPERATIAALAAVAMLTAPSAFVQVSVIVLGGVAGALLLPAEAPPGDDALPLTVRRCTGTILLVLSFALLAGLPLLAAAVPSQTLKLIDVFYRAGSLVFGGGHVVLPLLQAAVVPQGWSATTHSLRAMAPPRLCPGRSSPSPPISARRWDRLQTAGRARLSVSSRSSCSSSARFRSARICAGAQARAALGGINAAVVGLLIAAFYDPVWTVGITNAWDFALALRPSSCSSSGRRRLGPWSSSVL